MTIITNTSARVNITDADIRAFFLDILSIDLAGKSLAITYDAMGQITEIDVDISLTSPQLTQVSDEFFVSVSDSDAPSATVYLTDQGVTTPATILISDANVLTDISIVGGWNLRPDANGITLTDSDTGEFQLGGAIPRIVKISYALNVGITMQFDHVYAALMLTPDGGSKAEILGSRMYLETINGSDGMPLANSITIKLNPLDKVKINIANADGSVDMLVSIATTSVK